MLETPLNLHALIDPQAFYDSTAITVSPRYVPHLPQTRCET